MGEYQKTIYPGIFKYLGKNGTVYGIDYYAGGKKHREIVGPLLGKAKEKLEDRRKQAKKGIVVQKRITFRNLAQECAKFRIGKQSYAGSEKYYIGYWEESNEWKDESLTNYFGDWKIFQIGTHAIEEYKKEREDTPVKKDGVEQKRAGSTVTLSLRFCVRCSTRLFSGDG